MTHVLTEMQLRATEAAENAARKDGLRLDFMSDPLLMLPVARAVIRSLRDAPHSVLDQARGNRLASGDAAVFWNAMIDAISPPEEA